MKSFFSRTFSFFSCKPKPVDYFFIDTSFLRVYEILKKEKKNERDYVAFVGWFVHVIFPLYTLDYGKH
jgi:hypothetical protein